VIREALRSYASGCPGRCLADLPLAGTHTANESVCAGADGSSSTQCISMVLRSASSVWREGNYAVATLHLTRMSDASLKFQRL